MTALGDSWLLVINCFWGRASYSLQIYNCQRRNIRPKKIGERTKAIVRDHSKQNIARNRRDSYIVLIDARLDRLQMYIVWKIYCQAGGREKGQAGHWKKNTLVRFTTSPNCHISEINRKRLLHANQLTICKIDDCLVRKFCRVIVAFWAFHNSLCSLFLQDLLSLIRSENTIRYEILSNRISFVLFLW
jgi:hypothetical protein